MTLIRLKNVLPAIGRIILSVSVLLVGWEILSVMALVHLFINKGPNRSDSIPLKAALPITSNATSPRRSSLWPQFPIHGSIAAHELILSGTPVTIEEWEGSASPKSILDYYEIQMIARGWRDGMKEIRSLAEEAAAQLNQDGESVTASQLLQGDQPNEELRLELQRPGWSMSIAVEPSGKSINQSRVTIMAAPVPSLRDLSATLAVASRPASFGNDNKPLDIVQKLNGEHYHTTIAFKRKDTDQAFKESIADLRSKGWQLMSLSPFRQGRSDLFAWLVKGNQYATLSVKALPQSQSVSETFTEVSPE